MNTLLRKIIKMAQIAEHFPFLAMTYRTLRDNMATFQEPKITPMGFKFGGNPKMEEGIYEVDEVEIVKRYLEDVDIFINIGANIGYLKNNFEKSFYLLSS